MKHRHVRRLLGSLLVALATLGLTIPATALSGGSSTARPDRYFSDLNGAPFKNEINWMAEQGISTGWVVAGGNREYRPFEPVLRDAMAAFLYRMADEPEFPLPAYNIFADIRNPFMKEMLWMAYSGVSTGWMENGVRTYRPTQPVLRAEMAAFLYRLAGSPTYVPPATSPFTDVSPRHTFYKQISWLASTGISTGWVLPNGTRTFMPQQPILRDAMAAFLYRFDAFGYEVRVGSSSRYPSPETRPQTVIDSRGNTIIVVPPAQNMDIDTTPGKCFTYQLEGGEVIVTCNP
ncbi:MAG: S-layer homology domain-containing protein [bacterium]|nr:S-layer homology domain-containing protein [bacterium]